MNKKTRNKVIIIICILVLLLVAILGYLKYKDDKYKELLQKQEMMALKQKKEQEAKLLNTIKTNYHEYVKITQDTKLYKMAQQEYVEAGQVNKGTDLVLERRENLTIDDQYFKLANLDYYVFYKDITPTEKQTVDTHYKSYIPFDTNIITKIPTNFYKDDTLAFSINESIQAPIIINDSSYYYIEFDNRLLGIKKDNVEKTIEVKNNIAVATNIGVLNYHFFYNSNAGESCNEIICLETSKFEEQLKYLKDNNFYTATMNDFSLWMRKKIQLPKKTAVITVDDGAMGTSTHLISLLEKYDLHGTLFLITAWWPKDNYVSNNLEVQSHGHDIHDFTKSIHPALTMTKEQLLADFKQSISSLNGEKTAFCYPFYAHNQTVRNAVKEAGFEIAFVGGNVKSNQYNDPYQIRRYVIYSYTTLNQFINMVN